jgi:hypothetical protein
MNPQLSPDARIDDILTALRTTEPPTGLEARIAARIAQARSQPTATPSLFAGMLGQRFSFAPTNSSLAAALTLLVALTSVAIVHRRHTVNTALTEFNSHSSVIAHEHAATAARVSPTSDPVREDVSRSSRQISLVKTSASGVETISHRSQLPSSAQDPDQLALAETLAPSRPGPPLPLTTQEQTLVAATRPGQPIQLAELDLARAPILRAIIEARETARIDRYVRQSLAPLAVANALSPTTESRLQEAPTLLPPSQLSEN